MRRCALFAGMLCLPVAMIAGGCNTMGQGDYTREGVSLAKEKMTIIKAGTEWSMAHQAYLSGNLDKALDRVNNSLSLSEHVTKSHVLRGRILFEMGDLGSALQSLLTAETIDPQHAQAQYYLGIVYEDLTEREQALEHYRKASELDDHNPAFAVAAAEMMIDLGRLDEAKAYLNSGPAFEHNPGVRQALGHIALIEGDPERAVSMFEEAALLMPNEPAIIEDLVHAQMATGRFTDAERNIKKLLAKADPSAHRDLHHLQAQCLLRLDRPVEARTIYKQLTSGDTGSTDIDAWVGLGNTAFILGDERTLRRVASRVVAADPNRADGYSLWALLHRSKGDLNKSLASLNRAVEADPDDAATHAFRGLVLSDLGRSTDAISAFTDAVTLEPSNNEYGRMLEWAEYTALATAPATTN